MLRVLDDKAAPRLQKELGDPANFGIAKSMVMMGLERGFDMTSQEGMEAWMKTYNAELAAGTEPRIPFPGEQNANARRARTQIKRGIARNSRRQNRKKK